MECNHDAAPALYLISYAYVGCPDGNWESPGEWPVAGRGFGPCFDITSPPVDGTVLADVETGAFRLVLAS